MTIKAKLITNLLLTSAIVLFICLGGYSSLRFIQEKFLYSAGKSTHYRMQADKLHVIDNSSTLHGKETASNSLFEQEQAIAAVNVMIQNSLYQIAVWGCSAVAIGMAFGFWILRSVLNPLKVIRKAIRAQKEQVEEKAVLAVAVAGGDLDRAVAVGTPLVLESLKIKNDEFGEVLQELVEMSESQNSFDRAFADMTASLRVTRDENLRRDRLKNGLYELNKILREDQAADELADQALAFLAGFLGAGVGIMYLYEEKGETLQTSSTYAVSRSGRQSRSFVLGEGLPGQVALERKMIYLDSVPPGYLPITSAAGEADPSTLLIMPIMHNDKLAGVLELGSFRRFTDDDFDLLNQSLEGIAIAININRSRQLVNDLRLPK